MDETEVEVAKKLINGIRNGTLTDRLAIAKLNHFVHLLQEQDSTGIGNAQNTAPEVGGGSYGDDGMSKPELSAICPGFAQAKASNNNLISKIEQPKCLSKGNLGGDQKHKQRKRSVSPRRTNSTGFIPSIRTQAVKPVQIGLSPPQETNSSYEPMPTISVVTPTKPSRKIPKASKIAITAKNCGGNDGAVKSPQKESREGQGRKEVTRIPVPKKPIPNPPFHDVSKDLLSGMRSPRIKGCTNVLTCDQNSCCEVVQDALAENCEAGCLPALLLNPQIPRSSIPRPKTQLTHSGTSQLAQHAAIDNVTTGSKTIDSKFELPDSQEHPLQTTIPSVQSELPCVRGVKMEVQLKPMPKPRQAILHVKTPSEQLTQTRPRLANTDSKRRGPLVRRVVARSRIPSYQAVNYEPSISSGNATAFFTTAGESSQDRATTSSFNKMYARVDAENLMERHSNADGSEINFFKGTIAPSPRPDSTTDGQQLMGRALNFSRDSTRPNTVSQPIMGEKHGGNSLSPGPGSVSQYETGKSGDFQRPVSPTPPSPHLKRFRAKEHFTWLALS